MESTLTRSDSSHKQDSSRHRRIGELKPAKVDTTRQARPVQCPLVAPGLQVFINERGNFFAKQIEYFECHRPPSVDIFFVGVTVNLIVVLGLNGFG